MKEQLFFGTISSKGQVTVPVEARKALGLEAQDRLLFRLLDGKLEITAIPMTFAQLRGSIPALPIPLDDDEITRIAHEERVEAMIQEGRI